jgi:hypothetical protein
MKDKNTPDRVIPAKFHASRFADSDSNFYSLSLASDGCIYYTLCTHNIDGHGRIYRYDPKTNEVRLLGDLGDITGERGRKTIPQGKSHSPFFEYNGKMYTGTQYGFFVASGDKERPAGVPPGYLPYPGGHFLSCDLKTGKFEDLAIVAAEDGIIAMTLDPQRERMYALTWPRGLFVVYDMKKHELRNLGKVSLDGEVGEGDRYLCLCRAFGVEPKTGNVYFTNSDGIILRYAFDKDRIEAVENVSMRRDIFGQWDPHKPGHQGYNWRDLFWHEGHRVFYGIHPRSAWLFKFDPAASQLELIERLSSDEFYRSGTFEPFRYGYLTLRLGTDSETIYYLTGASGVTAEDGRRVPERTHLITYNLRTGRRLDHGYLRLPDGRYPLRSQTLAVHPNRGLYACPWIEDPTKPKPEKAGAYAGCRCNLISFELITRPG